jgi:hypothetical protein
MRLASTRDRMGQDGTGMRLVKMRDSEIAQDGDWMGEI